MTEPDPSRRKQARILKQLLEDSDDDADDLAVAPLAAARIAMQSPFFSVETGWSKPIEPDPTAFDSPEEYYRADAKISKVREQYDRTIARIYGIDRVVDASINRLREARDAADTSPEGLRSARDERLEAWGMGHLDPDDPDDAKKIAERVSQAANATLDDDGDPVATRADDTEDDER